MGQYWMLVNLDKCEAYRGSSAGKLGETLTSYNRLHEILKPFNVYHRIDKMQFQAIIDKEIRKYRRYQDDSDVHRASRRSLAKEKPIKGDTAFSVSHAYLSNMPSEILSMVFSNFEDIKDVLRFSLTCTRLFLIGYQYIQESQGESFPCWAGDRLICLGDYTKPEDLPEGVFTEAEKLRIKQIFDGSAGLDDEETPCVWDVIQRDGRFKKPTEPTKLIPDWSKFLYDLDLWNFSTPEWTLFRHLNELPQRYNSDNNWVLCNISKQEYIRADAISDLIDEDSLAARRLSIGTVLVTRICWSSDDSTALCYEGGNIHRGPWAGDRFKVTTEDQCDLVEWKDISDEVVEQIRAIWEAEYGKDWMENV